ncbi:MAG: hypothetical protein JWO03_2409 [Bacteroidetes bacterium]|nr:hypothetical protein [Bacteroidota bacterium]
MAIVAFNVTVKNIMSEVKRFDEIEQLSILAYLKARRIQARQQKPISAKAVSISLATIDAIKHKSRKHAGK